MAKLYDMVPHKIYITNSSVNYTKVESVNYTKVEGYQNIKKHKKNGSKSWLFLKGT